jgi:hypothetical protein
LHRDARQQLATCPIGALPSPLADPNAAANLYALPNMKDGYVRIPRSRVNALRTPWFTEVQARYGRPGGGVEARNEEPISIADLEFTPFAAADYSLRPKGPN